LIIYIGHKDNEIFFSIFAFVKHNHSKETPIMRRTEVVEMIMLRKLWENRPFQTPFSLNIKNEGIVL